MTLAIPPAGVAAFDVYVESLPCQPGPAVRIDAAMPMPDRSRLISAVPNPFNAATALTFEVGSPQDAQLSIVDSAGRLVRRFVLHDLSAGRHEVRWEGRDDAGMPTASGVYLVELRSGSGSNARKIVLVR